MTMGLWGAPHLGGDVTLSVMPATIVCATTTLVVCSNHQLVRAVDVRAVEMRARAPVISWSRRGTPT
jgi:hypothetical protein